MHADPVEELARRDRRGAEEERLAAGLSGVGRAYGAAALPGERGIHGRERNGDLVGRDLARNARRSDGGWPGVGEKGDKEETDEEGEPLFA
ncbi:MAG: hypothetical protein E6J15_14815 [Chloroflexi bacterium]|nr:MAG: hypothetical protein E6J15_14815 [Chloroflexota bacterium]